MKPFGAACDKPATPGFVLGFALGAPTVVLAFAFAGMSDSSASGRCPELEEAAEGGLGECSGAASPMWGYLRAEANDLRFPLWVPQPFLQTVPVLLGKRVAMISDDQQIVDTALLGFHCGEKYCRVVVHEPLPGSRNMGPRTQIGIELHIQHLVKYACHAHVKASSLLKVGVQATLDHLFRIEFEILLGIAKLH